MLIELRASTFAQAFCSFRCYKNSLYKPFFCNYGTIFTIDE